MKPKVHEHQKETNAHVSKSKIDNGIIKTLYILFIGTMLISTSLSAQTDAQTSTQSPSTEKLTVPLSNPGKPYTLKLGLVYGSIKVTGYSGKEILIEVSARNKNKKEDTEDAGNGMKRISPKNSFDITAKEENNDITVSNNHPEQIADMSLKVPQEGKLKLSTVNNGEIEVDNVNGEIEVNNVNGSIKLTDISGSAVASTVNGNVIAIFTTVDPKAPMAFTTLNGNVDLTLPPTAKSSFRLKSDRGEIFTDFDVSIERTPKAEKTAQSGVYQIKLDDWILCNINGGGPEVLMKNMNGNIYLRKPK